MSGAYTFFVAVDLYGYSSVASLAAAPTTTTIIIITTVVTTSISITTVIITIATVVTVVITIATITISSQECKLRESTLPSVWDMPGVWWAWKYVRTACGITERTHVHKLRLQWDSAAAPE